LFIPSSCTALGLFLFETSEIPHADRFLSRLFVPPDLNPNLFPLDFSGYPITRGLRVESACIVLIFLLGFVSQFKLFKLVKTRREKRREEREREMENLEHLEAEVGRRVEDNISKERAQWEMMYGDKTATASSRSEGKYSTPGRLSNTSSVVKD